MVQARASSANSSAFGLTDIAELEPISTTARTPATRLGRLPVEEIDLLERTQTR